MRKLCLTAAAVALAPALAGCDPPSPRSAGASEGAPAFAEASEGAPSVAPAKEGCVERAAVAGGLARRYGERPRGLGLGAASAPRGASGLVFEVWAAPSGSWTILASTAAGCVVWMAAGQAWHDAPDVPAEGPES